MTAVMIITLLAGAAIAFANGQNDVSKGISTLVGSGVTNYRRALAWGTAWTAAGALAGAVLGHAMISTFGKALLVPGITPTVAAAIATILGAAAWVAIASRAALPVSTTHAIVGALVGTALLAYGVGGLRWSALADKIVLPLVLGPVVAFALAWLVMRAWPCAADGQALDCACVTAGDVARPMAAGTQRATVAPAALPIVHLQLAPASACPPRPRAMRLSLDHLHWLTAGATSFARGLNDAPKLVALILAGSALTGATVATPIWFVVVTAAMVAGSWVGGRRVTEALAEKVTRLDHTQGFAANAITATLVVLATSRGLPLSTTHVATGAIVGAGARRAGATDWRHVGALGLAWVITLPAAAALAGVAYLILAAVLP